MHAEVVTALDTHLAELRALRRKLTDARAIEPGERLDVVLRIAASAANLADAVHALRPVVADSPPGRAAGEAAA
ncbi:hypothetical protein [Paractinoplanes hotanensis]|uniref:Uncharacterized protein n=1 Tax=Paractinoplanes hotanensis TaxID=2906497 RepID=A0ABT0YH72_9ACTN|nr:hypothetical protein [Actinoplanes hotanensis]MCM4085070.1 hypothetical protein [Actinoplanes hotanensis]